MSKIVMLCDSIVNQLTLKGSPLAQLLKPGLAVSEIHSYESRLPFVLPSSCLELYTWHNGTKLVSGSTFFPWWVFDELAESFERYRVLSEYNNPWDDSWFPLFSASDISSIGIACGNTRTLDGAIYCFDYTASCRQEFVSLEKMLETILAACEKGIIFWNKEEHEIDQDDESFVRLAGELNPGIARWSQDGSLE